MNSWRDGWGCLNFYVGLQTYLSGNKTKLNAPIVGS
jgi:hypothetical protein